MGGVLHPAQNIFSKIPNRMGATRATYIPSPNFWVGKMEGFISLLLDARTDFFIAHDKRYAMFAGRQNRFFLLMKNNMQCLPVQVKRITIPPNWSVKKSYVHEKIPTLLLDKLNESLQFQEEKKKAHSPFDWKISKTDHVRLAANVFVCNLDRANDTKFKEAFSFEKYILFLTLVSSSRIFH